MDNVKAGKPLSDVVKLCVAANRPLLVIGGPGVGGSRVVQLGPNQHLVADGRGASKKVSVLRRRIQEGLQQFSGIRIEQIGGPGPRRARVVSFRSDKHVFSDRNHGDPEPLRTGT